MLLIEGTRRLEQIINAHRAQQPSPPIDDVLARVEGADSARRHASGSATTARERPSDATRRWICTFVPTRELLASGIGVDAIRKRLAEIGTIVEATPQVRPDATISFQFTLMSADDVDVVQRPHRRACHGRGRTAVTCEPEAHRTPVGSDVLGSRQHLGRAPRFARRACRFGRLDHLMQSVGDMVISRARLADSLTESERYVPAVDGARCRKTRLPSTVSCGCCAKASCASAWSRSEKFSAACRSSFAISRERTARRCGSSCAGQTTEIDKYLIERMMDPVLHLVRNAVSHGIEAPDVRIASRQEAGRHHHAQRSGGGRHRHARSRRRRPRRR